MIERLERKLQITGKIVFETGWRIGSGRAGLTCDLGVLLDAEGLPLLPGSSIKGKLRSTCEALAPALNLKACLLNSAFSNVDCASDVKWYTKNRDDYETQLRNGPFSQLRWIEAHTCDVCKLFGSPVRAARLRCSDGRLVNPMPYLVSVRDGVVLDRDSHTAAEGLKYDYETVAAGTAFEVSFDLDNPTPQDEALLGAALFEWAAGSTLGGFTSRGLGRFRLEINALRGVDLTDPQQRRRYLLEVQPHNKLSDLGDWKTYFQTKIDKQLQAAATAAGGA